MLSNLLSAGTNFILNLYLILLYEQLEVIATTSFLSLRSVLGLLFVRRFVEIHPFKIVHLKLLAASFLAFPSISCFARYSASNLHFSYALLLLIMKFFEKEDLVIMRSIERRVGVRDEWLRKIIIKFL